LQNNSLRFASLFSGCGGFDLGFIEQGFKPIGAYDSDASAVENFKNNVNSDIHKVDLTQGIPNEAALKDIDALIAGPPCQGFSTAGKRNLDDARNHLYSLTGTLAKRINPKVLIVENVTGLLSGEHKRYLDTLDETMKLAGYKTNTLPFQTADIGMAQKRKRILFFAWRTNQELAIPTSVVPPSTLRHALQNLKGIKNHHPNRLVPHSKDWLIAKSIKQGQKLSNVRGGANSIATWDIPSVFGEVTDDERTILVLLRALRRQNRLRDYGDADPVSFSRLDAALGEPFHRHVDSLLDKGYLRLINGCIDLTGTFNGKYRRLSWEKPSCTVDTRFGLPKYFLHPSQQRGFTVREAARIQGFGDDYVFSGDEKDQYRLIGNAVPPPLGVLAATLTKSLLGVHI